MSESFYIRNKKQNEIGKILTDWWNNKVVPEAEKSLDDSLKYLPEYDEPRVLEIIKEKLAKSTTGVTLRISNTYSSSISSTLSWIAIGRWK